MPDHRHGPRASAFLAALVLGGTIVVQAARAHELKVFAMAEGKTVSGSVYSSGGGVAKHASVAVTGPGQRRLGETETDEEGQFTFEVLYQCDHTFTVTTVDGHRAAYTVRADELPDRLPQLSGGTDEGEKAEESPSVKAGPPGPAPIPHALDLEPVQYQELARMIERVVSKQVRPLREELNAYGEKIRLHDILGGIGYIFGVTGLAFYLKGRWREGRE